MGLDLHFNENKLIIELELDDRTAIQEAINILKIKLGSESAVAEDISPEKSVSTDKETEGEEYYICRIGDGIAKFVCRNNYNKKKYIIKKDSKIRPVNQNDYENEANPKSFTFFKKRITLLKERYIDENGLVLKDIDYNISSASTAASIVLGFNANGKQKLIKVSKL